MVLAMRPDALREFQPTFMPVSAAWKIDPLTTEGQRSFVTARFPTAVTEANALVARLQANPGLQVVAGNPALLGLVCRLHSAGKLSPEATASEVFDHALDQVLDESGRVSNACTRPPTVSTGPREGSSPGLGSETGESLASVVWELYRKDPSSLEFRESEFVEGLGTAVPTGEAGAFLNRLETLGLMAAQWPQTPGNRTFAWQHSAWAAHLAARHVARQGEEWRSLVAPFLWQETAMVSGDPSAPGGTWYRWETASAPFFRSLGWCLARCAEPKPGTRVAQLIQHLVSEETRCRSDSHFEAMLLLASLVLSHLPAGALPDDPEVHTNIDPCARAVVKQLLTHGRWAWRGPGICRKVDPREVATFPAARSLLRTIALADDSSLHPGVPPRSPNPTHWWSPLVRLLGVGTSSQDQRLSATSESELGRKAVRVLTLLGDHEIPPQVRDRLGPPAFDAPSEEDVDPLAIPRAAEITVDNIETKNQESLLQLRHLAEFSDQPVLRARAIRRLGVLGDRESARVLRTLVHDDSDETVLEAAIRALGMLDDAASIPTLRALVRDREDLRFMSTRTRRFEPAVKSLARLRDPGLLTLLRNYVRDGKDSRTVQYAILTLTRFDDLGAGPVLRELVASSDLPVARAAAISALATLEGTAALPDIRPLVSASPTYPVRLVAVDTVGLLRDIECLPMLRQLANSPHARQRSIDLAQWPGGAKPVPKPEVQESVDLKERAVEALARIGRPEDGPLIAGQLLQGWDRITHPDCLEALVRGGVDGTFQLLRRMLDCPACEDGLPHVQEALVRLGHLPFVRQKYPGEAHSNGCLRMAAVEGWFL
jgi:HEAT repeat protein